MPAMMGPASRAASVRTLIRLEPQSVLFLPDPRTLMRARETLLAEDDTSNGPP